MDGLPGSSGAPPEDTRRLLGELQLRDEELQKHRTAGWLVLEWWESQLRWLTPGSPPPPGITNRPLPASTRPRFPLDLRCLDQYPDRRPVFILGAVRSGTS